MTPPPLPLPPLSRGAMGKAKKKQIQQQHAELERLDSLPWNPSSVPLPNDNDDDDPFSRVNALEGGFLMLEEIDEAAYGLDIPALKVENRDRKDRSKPTKRSKKRKRDQVDASDALVEEVIGGEDRLDKDEKATAKKTNKKKMKKKKAKVEGPQKIEDSDDTEVEDKDNDGGVDSKKKVTAKEAQKTEESTAEEKDEVEEQVDENEYCAWNELRLHPLIIRSIYRLGFKEPTAIQKACIPAAAHQGKDVVGAAETGSGKTLAFGLPILQRLLDEREKVVKVFEEKGEEAEKVTAKGFLRALVITPTRELSLQVSDHLKAVAKDTDIRVVPIVGGMSTDKQERLLRSRPEIVVGTPGRLWELMSGGEKHLVEKIICWV
ncbi:DEAD-box ATP-dependent RNA helicase 13 isoform X2 [Argentina anserina]|uniref:DEAD-box ATP-dependent RNA helicase 13 isoform X2 n=1 Tax=Argentina anserina TaxID=57926 RepID=UPI00217630D2|nr:DEAD-box ATP-dependent RNA helicase 13 isoform X2 [Potentilla anserina]